MHTYAEGKMWAGRKVFFLDLPGLFEEEHRDIWKVVVSYLDRGGPSSCRVMPCPFQHASACHLLLNDKQGDLPEDTIMDLWRLACTCTYQSFLIISDH